MAKDRVTRLVRHIRSNIPGYLALTLALSLSPAIANHLNVQTSDLANGAVTRPKIDNEAVNGAKIAELPPRRFVGDVGQPEFADGIEGDCEWAAASPKFGSPHFFKDHEGFVHLGGAARGSDDTGGDGDCNNQLANQKEDGVIFRLPVGFRPRFTEIHGDLPSAVLIVGRETYEEPDLSIPPGTVMEVGNLNLGTTLDGIVFRADTGGADG